MAEPVIVPVQLEVTDVDMSNINFADASKEISKSLSTVKKSIQDAFNGIDASALNKSVERSMTAVEKSVQSAETAYLRYKEAIINAGKSTEEYKADVAAANMAIKNQEQLVNELSQLGPVAIPHLKAAQKELDALIEKRKQINPLDYVDKAEEIQLAKVANAYKNVLATQKAVNKKSEEFNQTAKDNRTTDEYQAMVKEAETYKKKLTELNEKSKYMEKYGATDKQWEKARKDADWYSSKLDEVIKKLRESVKTGNALRFGDGPKADLSRQINSLAMSGGNQAGAIKGRAMKNESPYTEDYQKALNELDKLEKKIEAIKEKSAKMIALGASKKQFESLAYDAENLDNKVNEAKNHLMAMVNEGGAFKFGNGDAGAEISKINNKSTSLKSTLAGVANGAKKAQGGLTALALTHPKLAAVLNVASKIANVLKTGFSVAAKAVGKVTSGFVSLGSRIVHSIKNMNLFGKTGRKTSTDLHSRFKKLTRNVLMFGLGFRTAYYAVKRLRTVFMDGFKTMGDSFDEIGEPMRRMIESFNRLKGSLATAFQPIVSVVMPILTNLMNQMSGILESIGKFTAALTGQKFIYKAVAKEINSVADSAKKANNQLGSYDKLEVIQDNNAGVDYEKTGIDASKESVDAASNFANMVKKAWENADFTSVGVYVTEQLLNVLDNVETNIIPKVTEFVNRLLMSINTFLDGFDSTAIGDKLGSIINTVLNGVDWSQVGLLFANLYSEVWQFLDGLVNSIDWALLGENLSTGLITLVDNLDYESLASMATGLTLGIITAIGQIDWAYIATTLLNGLQTVLQTAGDAMSSSDNPLVAGFGDVILAINEAITLVRPAIESIVSAISPIVQSILPVISQLLPPIAELISDAVVMVMPVLVSLFESIMPILGELIEIIMPILLDLMTSLQPIFDVLVETVLPVIVHLLDACMPLISGLLGLVADLLAPILALLSPLLEIVFNILDPVITILEPILDILGTVCGVVGDVLRPILDGLLPVMEAVNAVFKILGPIIEVLNVPFSVLAGAFKVVANIVSTVLVVAINALMKVIEVLMNVVGAVADAFATAFDAVVKVLDKAWTVIKKPINAMLGGFESLANGIIKAINSMIKAMNKLSFDVPDWVPGIGGKKFGFNLKEISTVKIPRLAQGAVIPPNKEFLAMLGDQKSGTNIEAPLDTIKQALAEVLAELGGVGSRQPIILQVNGRTLAQVVWDEQEKRYKQTGKAMA